MSAKTYYFALLLIVVATAFAMKSGAVSNDEEDRSKLIKFSHRQHIEDFGVGCVDCHSSASESTKSSDNLLSKQADCATCHEQEVQSQCQFCHTTEEYLPFENPDREVIFNHEQHIQQGLECTECHKGLEKVDFATTMNLPDMATCVSCHESKEQALACESCHTDFVTKVPKSHQAANFKREHRQVARLGAFDADCASCHTVSQCQDCHDGAILSRFTRGGDPLTPVSPRSMTRDTPNQMNLQMVHDLNYRFTHGIDAKARTTNCASCHSEQTFCSSCHEQGNILQSSIKPVWHEGPGFVTFGIGSGGGRHAEFARRDIESCASCHDTQGTDPTCITCHIDPDGIRGTNPKTHVRKFMSEDEGGWHSDPGAVCYNCHVDANARPGGIRGQGFCGYCHQ